MNDTFVLIHHQHSCSLPSLLFLCNLHHLNHHLLPPFLLLLLLLRHLLLLLLGIYTVSDQYPNGEYLRLTSDGAGLEVSPFDSVATGMYAINRL